MGDHSVHTEAELSQRVTFIQHLLKDIQALEKLLDEDLIEKGVIRIGAEQEFCLVNPVWRPAQNSVKILEAINDPHFTTELACYNLEINLDPFELKGDAFSKMEDQLNTLLKRANEVAAKYGSKVVLTGILPTISKHHVSIDYMTPNPRYYALNDRLKNLKGKDFRLHISGVEQLSIKHDSVMFEACNTSFQMHLQIDPSDFVSSYNWSQAIAGPIMGICVNAPFLLGRELWNETRIALFQQSIDTRVQSYALKDQESRVSFGDDWVEGSIAEIYKNEIAKFKIILSKEIEEDALAQIDAGIAPKLKALSLHNGTIYRWNRACYGVGGGKAHLRIENRYIPSGPSTIDEMANFAFWVGVMKGRPTEFDDIASVMDFKDAKSNFIKAARNGTETIIDWMGEKIPLPKLIIETFLPIARKGLEKMNIDSSDIDRYLNIIEKRTQKTTGASWMIDNYRSLQTFLNKDDSLIALTEAIYKNQQNNLPIYEWPEVIIRKPLQTQASKVKHIMSTKIISATQNDIAALTLNLMQWKQIHHLPIVENDNTLVGLLTWTHLQQHLNKNLFPKPPIRVADIMVKDVITVTTETPISKATTLMKKHEIGCLPVVEKGQLVGIITDKDLVAFDDGERV